MLMLVLMGILIKKEMLSVRGLSPTDQINNEDNGCMCATHLPSSVAKRRVASLWHVMRVRSATGRKLPGTNGRGRSRGRGGV